MSDATKGITLPLTIWEVRYMQDLLADERWQWIDGGPDSRQERLFQKLSDACDSVVGLSQDATYEPETEHGTD